MFCLKVDWKKRLVAFIISHCIMIPFTVWFVIVAGKEGIAATIVASIVYLLGSKDISFFGIDKSKKLGYYGGKVEEKWKPDLLAMIMRITGFAIILFYFIIIMVGKYAS